MAPPRVIVRLRGGLGNQLFEYATARGLARRNDAELVLDTVTGFVRDAAYRRAYALAPFAVAGRPATAAERLEPGERARRALHKAWARLQPWERRRYLTQAGDGLEPRLPGFRVRRSVILDGTWQSETYFADCTGVIRQDLTYRGRLTAGDSDLARELQGPDTVAVHVRWFDAPGASGRSNVGAEYYTRALRRLAAEGRSAHRIFVFSDRPEEALALVRTAGAPSAVLASRRGRSEADELHLMSQCRHFITANSTFSWWAAWLGEPRGGLIVCPATPVAGAGVVTAWNFPGQIPDRWLQV